MVIRPSRSSVSLEGIGHPVFRSRASSPLWVGEMRFVARWNLCSMSAMAAEDTSGCVDLEILGRNGFHWGSFHYPNRYGYIIQSAMVVSRGILTLSKALW